MSRALLTPSQVLRTVNTVISGTYRTSSEIGGILVYTDNGYYYLSIDKDSTLELLCVTLYSDKGRILINSVVPSGWNLTVVVDRVLRMICRYIPTDHDHETVEKVIAYKGTEYRDGRYVHVFDGGENTESDIDESEVTENESQEENTDT